MANLVSAPNKYFFYSESRSTVFYSETYPEQENDLVYIGTSNNPIPASAATAFMQDSDHPSGWKVKPWPTV
jgi:hypothetical protein